MEMVDVLRKLKEITDKSPEVAKAIESVTSTNPTQTSGNLVSQEQNALSTAKEGGMSDVHIGAQEVVGEYVDDNGNLTAPKAQVLQAMAQQKAKAPFPQSYEIETAMKMVNDDFDDNGQAQDKYEPEPDDVPQDVDTQMNMDAPAEAEQPELPGITPQTDNTPMGTKMFLDMGKKLDITFDRDQSMMIQGVLNTLDQEGLAGAVDTYKRQNLDPDQAESKQLNTNTMKTEDKKPLKEAITMSADTPEEAGMLMQIMKLAGVQQVTPDMLGGQEPTADVPTNDADHDHDNDGQQDHAPQDCNVCSGDDEVGSNAMGNMRDMISKNDNDEQAEETWDNAPDEKVDDLDTLVNVHSGGLNKQKQQVRKEYPGDNPLAVKEEPTEEELSNSLRTQYESFKKSYQETTKIAEGKGKDQDKDGDVDSKDYKKSKDIAIKKAMKK